MTHLPWILFLIGYIGYMIYDTDPEFWFRKTNGLINDDLVMLISVFVSYIGFVSSVIMVIC